MSINPTPRELPSDEEMLKAVGRGIQSFALVEEILAMLFSALMHPAPQNTSLIALDAVRHLESKLRMMRAVGKHRLTPESLTEFNQLMERIKDRSGVRHKIAHWTTSHFNPRPKDSSSWKSEVRLMPHGLSAGNLLWTPSYTIRIEQINEFCDLCLELYADLLGFVVKVQDWYQEAEERGNVRTAQIGDQKIRSGKPII